MTPLIDVTFQLIVFFMLVNNVASSENVPMFVPKLEDPQAREMGEITRIVVNVAPAPFTGTDRQNDPLSYPGNAAFVQIGALSRIPVGDLGGVTEALRAERAKSEQVEVLLRADAALYYSEVQPIMDAITAAGIETVNLVALLDEQ